MNGSICRHGVHERMHCEQCVEESLRSENQNLRNEVEELKETTAKLYTDCVNCKDAERDRLRSEVKELKKKLKCLKEYMEQ